MKRFTLPLAILAVAACSGGAAAPPREAGRAVTSLREIAGPWDIARFDGYAPTRLHEGLRRAYVDVGPGRLSYVIECNISGNPARVDASGTLHKVGDEPVIQTLVGCGPEREARDAALFRFLTSRPKAAWVEEARLRLFDGRTELILERPEMRRLANVPPLREIAGRWVPQMATRLLDGNGYQGWGFQRPHLLTITENRVSYPGCGGAAFAFRYKREGRMTTSEARGVGDCGLNEPGTMLLRVLRGGPLVERIAGGGIALTSGDEVISLRSEEEVRRLGENGPPPPEGVPSPPRPSNT